MFDDRASHAEERGALGVDRASGAGVQPIRIALEPIQGGTWSLPELHSSIPTSVDVVGGVAQQAVAAFALASDNAGVPLPKGRFSHPVATVIEQWRAYARQECGGFDPLSVSLDLRTTDEYVCVDLDVNTTLNVFRLKPLIEELNTELTGLGWLVYEAICAISSWGYPMYLPGQLSEFADYLWFDDAESDDEFLERLKERGDFDEDILTVKEARKHYHGQWPSDLLAAVDGQAWMLRWQKQQPPKSASTESAQAFLRKSKNATHKHVVASALALLEHTKSDSAKVLAKVGSVCDGVEGPNEQGGRYYFGAAAIVAWDSPDPLMEAIRHYEELGMQVDDGCTVHMVIRGKGNDIPSLERAAQQLKALVRHHALASKLLAPFIYEEE